MRKLLPHEGSRIRCLGHERGFTLIELLVVVVILGVFGSIGIMSFAYLVRRARAQSVSLEIAGWIENVRNAAADEVAADVNAGGCQLTFTPNAGNPMAAGDQLASVDGACTLPEDVLRIPQNVQQDTVTVGVCYYASNQANPPATTNCASNDTAVIFTPRGLWTESNGNLGRYLYMTISLQPGFGAGPLLRCVRLTPTLGSVEVGRPASSAGNVCTQWQLL